MRVNPGQGNLADQLVPIHRDFYLRVATAWPHPAREQALPAAEEAVEQGLNIPLEPGWFSYRQRYRLYCGFVTDMRGRRVLSPEKGQEVFQMSPPAGPVMPAGQFLEKA